LSVSTLPAINKQIEELHWNEWNLERYWWLWG
jgi:hypothetical protein